MISSRSFGSGIFRAIFRVLKFSAPIVSLLAKSFFQFTNFLTIRIDNVPIESFMKQDEIMIVVFTFIFYQLSI